jgi:hypothetical protein
MVKGLMSYSKGKGVSDMEALQQRDWWKLSEGVHICPSQEPYYRSFWVEGKVSFALRCANRQASGTRPVADRDSLLAGGPYLGQRSGSQGSLAMPRAIAANREGERVKHMYVKTSKLDATRRLSSIVNGARMEGGERGHMRATASRKQSFS